MTTRDVSLAESRIVVVARAAGVQLRREGQRLVGLCPLHAERRASFKLNPSLDAFHCFGCGKSGGYVELARLLGVNLDDVLPRGDGPAHAPRIPIACLPERIGRPELVSVWSSCVPASCDAEVTAWLVSRGFDPAVVQHQDLCRALPADARLPAWARYERTPWNARPEQYRAIFPLFNARGEIAGLRARAVTPGMSAPKALAPIGGGVRGLLLADDLGRRLLAADAAAATYVQSCAPRTGLVVAEGEPDFIAWATNWADGAERVPAVWGVLAGSWSHEIAARVPRGTKITIATDPDEAGDRYAAEIVLTLKERATAGEVAVQRWRPRKAS